MMVTNLPAQAKPSSRKALKLSTGTACSLLMCVSCATYQPAPLEPHAIAVAQTDASIDMQQLQTRLQRYAPDYQWDGQIWDSLALLEAALASNPDSRQALTALKSAQAAAEASRQAPGPNLTLSTEYAFNSPESSSWLLGVAGDAVLDVGGRHHGRIEAADIAIKQAELDYAAVLWDIRMAVRRAAIAEQFSRAETKHANRLVSLRRQQFEATQRKTQAGEISRTELERTRNDLSSAESTLVNTIAVAQRARIDLAKALGVQPEKISFVILADETALLGTQISVTDDMTRNAMLDRSEILKAVVDYDLAESELRTAVASQYPQIQVGPGFTWDYGLSKLPINIGLSFPTWDLNAAAIRAAEAKRTDVGARLESTIASAMFRITAAENEYQTAEAALAFINENILPTATELAHQADNQFEAGAIDRAEWAAAQSGLITSRLDQVNGQHRVAEALIKLEDALQMPLSGPEQLIGKSRPISDTEQ